MRRTEQLKHFEIITVAKVGSSSFKNNLEKKYPCHHSHNLLRLKKSLSKGGATIVSGIRNPIDRNLSYFFQTYKDKFFNSFKTKQNKYQGEYCFVEELKESEEVDDYTKAFFNQSYLFSFNEWFEEFLDITEIKDFDKQKGYQLYDLGNDNKLFFYKLEDLNSNIDEIKTIFDLQEWNTTNVGSKKKYSAIYKKTKEQIQYPQEYLDRLLTTDTMKIFYTEDEINSFYSIK